MGGNARLIAPSDVPAGRLNYVWKLISASRGVVRTKADRRIARWTMELQRWTLTLGRLYPQGSDEANYALGVNMAISVCKRGVLPIPDADLAGLSEQTQHGYRNGIALINQVVERGDAPNADFVDLLGASSLRSGLKGTPSSADVATSWVSPHEFAALLRR
jgi:hypothetical protein